MTVILFKVLIVVTAGLLGASLLGSRMLETLPDRSFLRRVLALQLVPALGLFVALYVVGHEQVTSDVPSFYIPAARATLAGQVPFRDFTLSYAPLFPYVGAALIAVWNSGKVFALFDILVNALTLLLWHSTASAFFSPRTVRESSILYATSGHLIVQALLGTNQSWIAAALAGSALLIVRGHSASSGFVQAVSVCITKFLALLFWPVVWIFAPRRTRWLSGAVLCSVAVYGGFLALGADILDPLRREGELVSSGNLPYLLDALVGTGGYRVFDGLALAALMATTAWLYWRTRGFPTVDRPRLLFAGVALTGLVFMLVSKKSFTGYAIFFMYPLVLVLVVGLASLRARVAFLLAFNVLLAAEPSLWFHLRGYDRPLSVWLHGPDGLAARGFVLIDLTLIACYVYLAYLSVRCVQRTVDGAMAPRNASQSATACSLV
jgi:hypothetical protein